ncbi:MAG: hypothetical protein GY757_18740 [bacterium]|nr:hypothetical protein [bacterium]
MRYYVGENTNNDTAWSVVAIQVGENFGCLHHPEWKVKLARLENLENTFNALKRVFPKED